MIVLKRSNVVFVFGFWFFEVVSERTRVSGVPWSYVALFALFCCGACNSFRAYCVPPLPLFHTALLSTDIFKATLRILNSPSDMWSCAMCVRDNVDHVISGSLDHSVRVWSLQGGGLVRTLCGHEDEVLCIAKVGNSSTLLRYVAFMRSRPTFVGSVKLSSAASK